MGEWDTSDSTEPLGYMEFNVGNVTYHPKYKPASLQNSVAVLRLTTNVPLGRLPTISTACLPGKLWIAWDLIEIIWIHNLLFQLQCFKDYDALCQAGVETILHTAQTKRFKGRLIFRWLIATRVRKHSEWQNWGITLFLTQASCVLVKFWNCLLATACI